MEEFKAKVSKLAELKKYWEDSKAETKRAQLLADQREKEYLRYSTSLVKDFKALGFEELKIEGESYKLRTAIESLKVKDKKAAMKYSKENGARFWIEVQQTGTIKKFVKAQLASQEAVPDFLSYEEKEYVKAGKGAK